jgi:hypothetical protein
MEYSGAGGKLIHEKNQKQKISWHCPFKLSLQPRRKDISDRIAKKQRWVVCKQVPQIANAQFGGLKK